MTTCAEEKARLDQSIEHIFAAFAETIGLPRSWIDAVFDVLMWILQSLARVANRLATVMREALGDR